MLSRHNADGPDALNEEAVRPDEAVSAQGAVQADDARADELQADAAGSPEAPEPESSDEPEG